ncbi:MAG: hypothetical protein ACRDNX_00415 [Gaiellaceae bacterium]
MKLALVIVALVLAAGAAAYGPPPDDARSLPVQGGLTTVSRIQPKFSSIASSLARRPAEVRCWSIEDWAELSEAWALYTDGSWSLAGVAAYAAKGTNRIQASPTTCARLSTLPYTRSRPAGTELARVSVAIWALGHEAAHLAGFTSEAVAECRGLQHVRVTARALGATATYAAKLAAAAWRRYPARPATYRSRECRNGGALDLRPASSVWP